MSDKPTRARTPVGTRLRNLSLAAVAAQAGCLTLVIVFAALFIGLWLDSRLDERGPFTFGLLCLSVPVSLYAMLRLSISAINRIVPQPVEPPSRSNSLEEE